MKTFIILFAILAAAFFSSCKQSDNTITPTSKAATYYGESKPFGGDSIRHFVIILLVGVFSGTYSSIFNASPILVVWENQEWKNWFGGKKEEVAA